VVNHRVARDLEIAYLFDAKTLDQIDLGGRIAAADPELGDLFPTGPIRRGRISMQGDGSMRAMFRLPQ
jgi:hypothetical protein